MGVSCAAVLWWFISQPRVWLFMATQMAFMATHMASVIARYTGEALSAVMYLLYIATECQASSCLACARATR